MNKLIKTRETLPTDSQVYFMMNESGEEPTLITEYEPREGDDPDKPTGYLLVASNVASFNLGLFGSTQLKSNLRTAVVNGEIAMLKMFVEHAESNGKVGGKIVLIEQFEPELDAALLEPDRIARTMRNLKRAGSGEDAVILRGDYVNPDTGEITSNCPIYSTKKYVDQATLDANPEMGYDRKLEHTNRDEIIAHNEAQKAASSTPEL